MRGSEKTERVGAGSTLGDGAFEPPPMKPQSRKLHEASASPPATTAASRNPVRIRADPPVRPMVTLITPLRPEGLVPPQSYARKVNGTFGELVKRALTDVAANMTEI
jgi:hypothetical protein